MSLRNRVLESKELEITQNYKKGYHDGIDVVNKNYTLGNIVAHSNGIVVSYRNDCNGFENGSYGNYVKIIHNERVSFSGQYDIEMWLYDEVFTGLEEQGLVYSEGIGVYLV